MHTYTSYLQNMENEQAWLQPRQSQITQQYSSSTDEGCDTDHGEIDDAPVPPPMQRLNSYASSSSSSGVVANIHSKSLSQNLSCDSSRSNFSTFESFDLNLSDCSDLAGSLPSCASGAIATDTDAKNESAYTSNVIYYRWKLTYMFLLLKLVCRPVISASVIHPCVYVSMSAKSSCSFSRHNPLGHHSHGRSGCRAATRSPVDFR